MRHTISALLIVVLAFLAVGCSSSSSDVPAELLPPRFRLRLPAGQIQDSLSGDVSLNIAIDIFNDSGEDISLERIQIQPVAGSNITFIPARRILRVLIPANDVRTVDLWVEATVRDANGPIESDIRGTAVFDSEYGTFRRVFVGRLLERAPEPTRKDG